MTRRAAIEAMVERAMERAGKDILASLDYELVYREAANLAAANLAAAKLVAQTIVTPRLTSEQKREKANAYMRAYKERKKAEKHRSGTISNKAERGSSC